MQTLFTSDRMIVEGEQRKHPGSCTENCEKFGHYHYLSLKFIFQVNGKLTIYEVRFQMKSNDLLDYTAWNAVCKLFFSMGYKFEEQLTPAYGIIKGWLESTETKEI